MKNSFADGPPRRHGRSTLTRRLAAAAFAAALGLAPVSAGPPAGPSDLELTLRVKTALSSDPALKGVNPVVSVVDRVAVIGGPVPDDAAAARVAAVARGVAGLADARVSCWVDAGDDPLRKMVADRLRTDAKPAAPPAVLHDPRPAATVVAQRIAPSSGGFLLDPVSPTTGRVPGSLPPPVAIGSTQYPTIPAPAVPVMPKQDLASAVEEVRKADTRFDGLTVAFRGDAVVIAGRAADGDAWDLAAALRKVPGVTRVALGRIDAR